MHATVKLAIVAVAFSFLGNTVMAQQSTSQTSCTRNGDGYTCTNTYTPAARPAPVPEPVIRGPGTRQDVVWFKPNSAPEPTKPADNHCGPGFRMMRDFSCQLAR